MKRDDLRRTALGLGLLGILVEGCAVVPDNRIEARQTARSEVPVGADRFRAAEGQAVSYRAGWLDAFGDPVLVALVEEAQANNRDLRAAAARVEEAWALAGKAGAALAPQAGFSFSGGAQGTGATAPVDASSIGVQASWELDLWGRVRSGRQAAEESAEAAAADYRFAQESLAAAVTRAYFFAVEAHLREGIAAAGAEALGEIVRIVGVQKDEGLATAQDLALARSDLSRIEDLQIAAGAAKRDALRSLEILLGRYPGAELEVAAALPGPPPPPPPGLPSQLLERRPDLIAAERRLASAMSRVGEAKAARLPRIALTGSFGGASSQLASLLNPANTAWTAASSLMAPVLDGGALQQDVVIANARQQAALDAYVQSALDAFGEVEGSLDRGQVFGQREAALRSATEQAGEAYRLSRINYEAGETGLLDVLEVQLRGLQAQNRYLSVQRGRLVQFVDLNLALGGSWDDPAADADAPASM